MKPAQLRAACPSAFCLKGKPFSFCSTWPFLISVDTPSAYFFYYLVCNVKAQILQAFVERHNSLHLIRLGEAGIKEYHSVSFWVMLIEWHGISACHLLEERDPDKHWSLEVA